MTDMENKEIATGNEELEEILREAMKKQALAEVEKTDGIILEGRIVGFAKLFGEDPHTETVVFGPGPDDKEIFSHGDPTKIDRNIMKIYIGMMIDQRRRNIPSWVIRSLKILPKGIDLAYPSPEIRVGFIVSEIPTMRHGDRRCFRYLSDGWNEGPIIRIGRWTDIDPYEEGPFFVFKNKEDAEKYRENLSGKVIFSLDILEVQYVPSVDEKGEPFKYGWERNGDGPFPNILEIDKPKGMDAAFSLRPLRVVR